MGDSEHDGSLGLQECRGSHQDCNRSEEGTINAVESEGAGRSADCGHLPENQGGFVGNSEGWSNGQQPTEQQGRDTSGRSGEESGTMGNSTEQGCERSGRQDDSGWAIFRSSEPDRSCTNGSMEPGQWQAEPTLGGDSDGAANRMDDAELFVTSDNRTDELRLLGNGVVPATATRAFLVLMDQLLNETP